MHSPEVGTRRSGQGIQGANYPDYNLEIWASVQLPQTRRPGQWDVMYQIGPKYVPLTCEAKDSGLLAWSSERYCSLNPTPTHPNQNASTKGGGLFLCFCVFFTKQFQYMLNKYLLNKYIIGTQMFMKMNVIF